MNRPEIIALTKVEGLDDEMIAMQIDALRKVAGETPVFAVSAQAHKGIPEVLRALRKEVEAVREAEQAVEEVDDSGLPVISLSSEQKALAWSVEKVEEAGRTIFVVAGHKIEKFARRTHFDTHDGLARLRDIMKKMGITNALTRAGAQGDSIIRIGRDEFTLVEL